MSSSQALLAYVMRSKESAQEIAIRKAHAEDHIKRLYPRGVARTDVGDGGSGFIGWTDPTSDVLWTPHIRRGDTGIAWLHIPGVAGGPDSGVQEWDLAHSVLDGRISTADIGSPFAIIRWHNGVLDIANDMLGLVRLFHFSFTNGDVWTTRPGLAHVFMGVAPQKNLLAWSGMATLGWATSGTTQLGDGVQLAGGSRISATWRWRKREITVWNTRENWFQAARESAEPSPDTAVGEMELAMSTAKRWPREAIGDLSGGRDSRVVAAVGIQSGAIKTVRTIATDHGEVETAQHLLSLIRTRVEHRVQPKRDPSIPGGDFLERIASQHHAWEGRYLATTTYNTGTFTGFRPVLAPTFNGLGGEVMAGGNLSYAWTDRLTKASPEVAQKRLAAMAGNGVGASELARSAVTADISSYLAAAADLQLGTASGVLDVFYASDKMPNWSITYAAPNTLTPLFVPSLLRYGAQRAGNPTSYGDAHRRLLRGEFRRWADVPFYKPVAKKRAMPWVWDNHDWQDVRAFVLDQRRSLATFDPDAITTAFDTIGAGGGTRREEILIQRFLWEATFSTYVSAVAEQANATANAVRAARGNRGASRRWLSWNG